MIHRTRGERPQKGNPHNLTRDQHVIPESTLHRFAGADGLVEVHFRDSRVRRVATDNELFSVDRLWDQRSEAGYMNSIERCFKTVVDDLESGRLASLRPEDHRVITRFWSLWRWRSYFVDFPETDRFLNGVKPDTLTKDQMEVLESNWGSFIKEDGTLPARGVTGLLIQMLVDRDELEAGRKLWGVMRGSSSTLIIPDRPGSLMAIPASPRLLLGADNPDGDLTPQDIERANAIAIRLSRNYVIVPPH